MWIRASLVGTSLGRKNLELSASFILQVGDSQRTRRKAHFYRIITRNFPHYKVAESNNYEEIKENFRYLNEVLITSIDRKKSSKNIASWLRCWYEQNMSSALTNNASCSAYLYNHTGEEKPFQVSVNSTIMESVPDSCHGEESRIDCYSDDTCFVNIIQQSNHKTTNPNGPTESSIMNTLHAVNAGTPSKTAAICGMHPAYKKSDIVNVISEPTEPRAVITKEQFLEQNWSPQRLRVARCWLGSSTKARKSNRNIEILDIPSQLIPLLTYPDIDRNSTKKPNYGELREISRVIQRRKALLCLTFYVLVIRYSSFDLFLLIFLASGCGVLFLMKSSCKVNAQMAKRTVHQRVSWAKKWMSTFLAKSITASDHSQSRNALYSPRQSFALLATKNPSKDQPTSYFKSQNPSFTQPRSATNSYMTNENINGTLHSVIKQKRRFFSKFKEYHSSTPAAGETGI